MTQMLHEAWHILSDPGHMLAELFTESVFLVVGLLIAHRHERKHHDHATEEAHAAAALLDSQDADGWDDPARS